jgi:MOSC domain-containing protein YiiM
MTGREVPLHAHLTRESLEQRFHELPAPPLDVGKVALVVRRPDAGVRELPPRARLTVEGGLEGDRWAAGPDRKVESQVTLMRADVSRLVANGQPVELCGDNLLVELDLSKENLPAGTRIEIGTALCEVTPKPHTGCSKFSGRFGADALAFAAGPEHASRRLRGIHVRVLEDGEVSPGDVIRVRRS